MTQITDIPLAERRMLVRDSIFKHGPEHFDITVWFCKTVEPVWPGEAKFDDGDLGYLDDVAKFNITDCGTTACIAGHCAIVAHEFGIIFDSASDAAEWLALPEYDGTADHPFSPSHWMPEPVRIDAWGDLYVEDTKKANEQIHPQIVDWLDGLVMEAMGITV